MESALTKKSVAESLQAYPQQETQASGTSRGTSAIAPRACRDWLYCDRPLQAQELILLTSWLVGER
ncbi:hypothetical protein [Rubidibacter lacunae]|uniref:hypothetical protein n=1 Tax=Rubidibacter lacunae TaxID=582514 RepID=UPI000410BBA8|nr:hypothetical protein [Rubidibacter lacunae]